MIVVHRHVAAALAACLFTSLSAAASERAAAPNKAEETRVLRVAIEGMVTPNCPVLVKSGLSRLPGVVRVNASLEQKTAEVVYLPKQISEETLLRTLKTDIGFSAVPIRETRLAISGMLTKNCPVLVKRAVGKLAGVKSVSASLEDKSATVTWLEGSTTPTAIALAIKERTGFAATVVD